jgi:hypothetical protein
LWVAAWFYGGGGAIVRIGWWLVRFGISGDTSKRSGLRDR